MSIPLRTRVAVLAGRTVGTASRLTGRGAGHQIAGRTMRMVDPSVLEQLGAGREHVLISATNGKTTITRMLRAILEANGEQVASNVTGANLAAGVAAALAASPRAPRSVLEVDERALPAVLRALRPSLVLLANLSRDQLDRHGEVGTIANTWRALFQEFPDTRVIANASDPAVVFAATPAQTTWIDLGLTWRDDAAACPECGALLTWDTTRFACSTCDFAQPTTEYVLDGNHVVIEGERVPVTLQLPGSWNVANAALALVAAHQLGVDPPLAANAVGALTTVSDRYRTYLLPDGRELQLFLAKNPAGWSEVLRHLQPVDCGVVLAVNAHIADGKDPSWLWDVPYELLAGKPVAAAGERALDMAVRLQYGEVEHVVERDPIVAAINLGGPRVNLVASYTQFHSLARSLAKVAR